MKKNTSFKDAHFCEQTICLNQSLDSFTEKNPNIRQAFTKYFVNENVYRFNLEKWGGNQVNPSLDIVQIKGKLKFAIYRYGVFSPLSLTDWNNCVIMEVILDFFINPLPYFQKNNISIQL